MLRRLPSIRRLLVLLSLAWVLPVSLFAAWMLVDRYQQERALVEAGAVTTARALASALDDRVRLAQGELARLARSPALKASRWDAFRTEAIGAQQVEEVSSVVLLSEQGQVVNTLSPAGAAPPRRMAPQMQLPLQTGQPAVSGVFNTPLRGRPAVAIGVPAFGADNTRYAVLVLLEAAQLREVLVRQKLPPGWLATLLDAEGNIIARTQDHDRFVGQRAREELLGRIRLQAESTLESTTLDGIPVVTAFSRAAASGWTVTISIPRAELRKPLLKSFYWLLAGALGLLAFSAWLAWKLGSAIAGSIRQLAQASTSLAGGEGFEPPRAAFQEANDLGMALHATAGAIADARSELERQAQRLDAIVDTAMDGILSVEEDGRIVLFNRAAETLFRIPREQALGLPVETFIPAAHRDGHAARMLAFGREARPARMMAAGRVVQAQRADGEVFPVEASISVAREEGRRLFTVILRDVTERQRHLDALTRSNLELQQFAFVASHDLRTPMRSVMGYLELIARRHGAGLGDKGMELVQRALRAGRQMDVLTSDLLGYARLDAQVRPMAMVELDSVLADALQMLDATVRETGAQVRAEPLPPVLGDRGQLVQLMLNLLGNALKYCRGRAPEVKVWAERGDGEWICHVSDNGIGIEPAHQERIFEIFKRLHTQQEFPGSGIGLAVCRRVVERHNGRIWCTSTPGEGSTFSFTIADARSEE
jgi:PAS domain S-box-containing protein